MNDDNAPFNYFKGVYSDIHEINDGELLFSWSGTPGISFGAFRWYRGKGVLNQHIFRVIPKVAVDRDYLKYALNGNLQTIIAKAHGGVGLQHITKKELDEIDIPIPSEEQQRHIVACLQQNELIIAIRKNQLHDLDQLIKARFVEMFGSIRETVSLSYYIDSLVAGKSLAGEEKCTNKVLKTGAATYDYFDASQVKNLPKDYVPLPEHLIHDGDVIISRMNTAELVGAAAYIWAAPKNTYLPDRLWRAELTDKANPIFVWQSIIQPTTKEAIRRIAGGTSGSMKNISKPGLLGLHVKKVEMSTQNKFASFVSQVHKSKVVELSVFTKRAKSYII